MILKDSVVFINLNNVGSQEECKHSFHRVLIGNDIYWQCAKCSWLYDCKHEWNYEIKFNTMFFRCSKCGIDAMAYKCSKCERYTPHWFYDYKGTWKSTNFELMQFGTLEEYKCLICGNTKTIRYGGSFARMR